MLQSKPLSLGSLALTSLICFAGAPVLAQSAADFYKGKTVTIVVGTGAGGGYDFYARLVARYIPAHIPGNPNVIVTNMPGAASRVAAMHLNSAAPKDGTVIGHLNDNIVNNALLDDKISFDIRNFNWLARLNSYVGVGAASKASGITSVKDALTREVVVGATAVGSNNSLVPALLNRFENAKFKIVYGYKGSQDISLAMERREVDVVGSLGWEALKPDLPMRQSLNLLYQFGIERHPDLPDVPVMHELGTTPESKAILKFFAAGATIGRSFVAPPGVPADRVKILRTAFQSMLSAKDFKEDLKKQNIELDPATGERMAEIVAEVLATPPNIIALGKEAMKK